MTRQQIRRLIKDKYARYVIQIIAEIRAMPREAMLSGEDVPMQDVWEEWLVQMQGEESFAVEAHEQSFRAICRGKAEQLPCDEQELLWFETEKQWGWDEAKEAGGGVILDALEEEFYIRLCQAATDAKLPARLENYVNPPSDDGSMKGEVP